MSSTDFGSRTNKEAGAHSMLLDGGGLSQSPQAENWRECFPEFVGRSEKMNKVLETVSKIARTESAVLVLGESGTGKELIASAIHRLSPRSTKRFIAINCSAIPENLLESELFGHERGAFTGADRRRVGHFELATGGTIFLDEIGDMPLSLQSKLLRVLQEKKFTPLGGADSRQADVRIIAATNKNLEEAVAEGSFRLDLYYRLNVLPISLPSLRERKEDTVSLLENFLDVSNRNHPGQSSCFFSDAALQVLVNYSWPGNVRQLINLVERLVVLSGGGKIEEDHLPEEIVREPDTMPAPTVASPPPTIGSTPIGKQIMSPGEFGTLPEVGLDLTQYVEQLENSYILQALERTGNNKNQAAKLLGMNRTTLVERIKKRRIKPLNAPSKEL